MRKICALFLAALMVISVVGGCKKDSEYIAGTEKYTTDNQTEESTTEESTTKEPETEEPTTEEPTTEEPTTETPTVPVVPELPASGLSTESVNFSYGIGSNEQVPAASYNAQLHFNDLAKYGIQAVSYDSKTTEKVLYLTFDCGYEYNGNTVKILDVLKDKNVKGTFFVLYTFASKNPVTVQRMIDEGHIVGSHSSYHKKFPEITRDEMIFELTTVADFVKNNYNYDMEYFRFPSGTYSDDTMQFVASQGYKIAFWSCAHRDFDVENQPDPKEALDTLLSRIHPGAVILLHSLSDTNAQILGQFIDEAIARGYTFKNLDELNW